MTDVKNMKLLGRSGSNPNLDLTLSSAPSNSFITDICAFFVRDRANWLPAATWVLLLEAVNIPSASARTALHRMFKAGYLQREVRHGRPGYGMTPLWIEWMGQVGGMLSPSQETAEDHAADAPETDDSLALVTFSIPESKRADRHAIRRVLGRNGFAPLGNGVWIASGARLRAAELLLRASGFVDYADLFAARYQGFAELPEFVRRCWDIEAIDAMYRDFIRDVQERSTRNPGADPRTFADVILTSNAWRRINFVDPLLPKAALPSDWPREDAERLGERVLTRFLGPAHRYVDSLP